MGEVGSWLEGIRMQRVRNHRFWRSGVRAIPGTALVGLVTFICYGLGLNVTITGFLYLIVIVFQSLVGDFVSSVIVSIIADLCLNFFFIPPIFSFRVSDASDIWALVSFLVTGLVITRLTTQLRRQAEISEVQRLEMKLLYELAQRLLALDPQEEILAKSVALFRAIFGLRAVCLYDGINVQLHSDGGSQIGLADRTRTAYISRQDNDDAVAGVFIRPLLAAGNTMGAIGFEGLRDAELTAGPLTALAAPVLERVCVFRDASHATAEAQAEVFRGAILDALAHEFKTPLATIVAAAGGLRETGGLRPEQLELAETAERESAQLGLLTSRLLRIARLDREEVKPYLEPTDIGELVTHLADYYVERWPDRKFSLTKDIASVEVRADAELLRLAVRQLLDNACKYSPSGSDIKISIELQHQLVALRVWNSGNSVPANERAKIFERFYRGSETHDLAPGSGLGLYVARKIVRAHGGDLDLEDGETLDTRGTTFRLTIPVERADANHVGGPA
jgi:two-component system, OmpR family, sensor histidine kinase KdpD